MRTTIEPPDGRMHLERGQTVEDRTVVIDPGEAVARAALEQYDFSPDVTLSLVNVSENTTYRVDDHFQRRSAALRIHRPNYHSDAAIESELDWMDALRASGVVEPPQSISSRTGARVANVALRSGETRSVVMFEWLSGAAPTTDGDLVPSFRVLGSLAAKMHRHGAKWKRPESFDRYTCDYEAALGPAAMWGRWQDGLGMGSSETKLLSRLDTRIRQRLAAYGKWPDRFGLTHNDLRLANLLIDGDHVQVIDFDDCGFSWYMYDFATAVSFIEDDPRVPTWMGAWLDGYTEHRPLTAADESILSTLIMFRRLLLVGWVGSHHSYAAEAAELGPGFTSVTCELAEQYLSGRYLA
jgi:Ser/Thr protein kinase RdoA (MazF antagonist)